ncbi:hypothetical protein BJ875DRAFT_485346 [Amylocarpus encephaloides]|uniref:Uncharacterized protein n=1 Tax=Amylocarpus encephaloides TaxID=45428 RepID=A0A9P8C5N9_9HELO|nr:hypothetical protein BJ875DRAFT_485346 [Amylocarpus encephaloides]
MAALVARIVPSGIAKGVAVGVKLSAGLAMEVQHRTRTKTYLDRMNDEFFKPRGLYYMTSALASKLTLSSMEGAFGKLEISKDTTRNELEMPEATLLVYPSLDALAAGDSHEALQKKNGMKDSQDFVSDYMDRRAQAKFACEHPDSSLPTGAVKSTSRYADPNSKANTGGIVGLVTGGAVTKDQVRVRGGRERRRPLQTLLIAGKELITSKGGKSKGKAVEVEEPEVGEHEHRSRRDVRRELLGLKDRQGATDVYYLMIVNLPSEEGLKLASAALNEEEQEIKGKSKEMPLN